MPHGARPVAKQGTDIYDFINANATLIFAAALLWVIGCAGYFARRRHLRGPLHPPYAEQEVRFTERFASGFSYKNLFTRFGGSHNALVVRVLKDALLIEPMAPFKWITPAGFNDLEHYVPKNDILGVETVPGFGRQALKVRFRGKDGAPKTLEIKLRKFQQFLWAMDECLKA